MSSTQIVGEQILRYFVNSENDPESFVAYVHPINTNTAVQDITAGEYYENAVKWGEIRYNKLRKLKKG